MAGQVMDIVGFFLPDPEKLVKSRPVIDLPDGLNGEFLPKVIAVDYAEQLDRMGRRPVLPTRAHLPIGIPNALFQYIPAVLQKNLIRLAQFFFSFRREIHPVFPRPSLFIRACPIRACLCFISPAAGQCLFLFAVCQLQPLLSGRPREMQALVFAMN